MKLAWVNKTVSQKNQKERRKKEERELTQVQQTPDGGIVYTPTIAVCGKALAYYPEHSLSVRGGQFSDLPPHLAVL